MEEKVKMDIRYKAKKLFEIAPPKILGGESSEDSLNVNDDHGEAIKNSKEYEEAINAVSNILDGIGGKTIPDSSKKNCSSTKKIRN